MAVALAESVADVAVILAAFWGGAYLVSGTARTANVLSMIFLLMGVAGALFT